MTSSRLDFARILGALAFSLGCSGSKAPGYAGNDATGADATAPSRLRRRGRDKRRRGGLASRKRRRRGAGERRGAPASSASKSPAARGTPTTVSGTVYDPGGNVPLYNIVVYVPNPRRSTRSPRPAPRATQCGVEASGSPIVKRPHRTKTGIFTLPERPRGERDPARAPGGQVAPADQDPHGGPPARTTQSPTRTSPASRRIISRGTYYA